MLAVIEYLRNLLSRLVLDDWFCQNDPTIEIELEDANLRNVSFAGANLREADLSGCILIGSNFENADLSHADLSNCSLSCANLAGANLTCASHSVPQMLVAFWGDVSEELCRDMMRLDASAHPEPRLFDNWAYYDAGCPYLDSYISRVCYFNEDPDFWKSGRPPSLWRIWCRLAAEKNVKIGYDKNGRPIKEEE